MRPLGGNRRRFRCQKRDHDRGNRPCIGSFGCGGYRRRYGLGCRRPLKPMLRRRTAMREQKHG